MEKRVGGYTLSDLGEKVTPLRECNVDPNHVVRSLPDSPTLTDEGWERYGKHETLCSSTKQCHVSYPISMVRTGMAEINCIICSNYFFSSEIVECHLCWVK